MLYELKQIGGPQRRSGTMCGDNLITYVATKMENQTPAALWFLLIVKRNKPL